MKRLFQKALFAAAVGLAFFGCKNEEKKAVSEPEPVRDEAFYRAKFERERAEMARKRYRGETVLANSKAAFSGKMTFLESELLKMGFRKTRAFEKTDSVIYGRHFSPDTVLVLKNARTWQSSFNRKVKGSAFSNSIYLIEIPFSDQAEALKIGSIVKNGLGDVFGFLGKQPTQIFILKNSLFFVEAAPFQAIPDFRKFIKTAKSKEGDGWIELFDWNFYGN